MTKYFASRGNFRRSIVESENKKKELLEKKRNLKKNINILEKELEYINSQKITTSKKSLEEALKIYSSKKKFFLHSISVGDEEYIELNDIQPEDNIESHIVKAKQGSKKPIHVKLRQFGYLSDFHLIKEFENEILGLVSEIIQIKKQRPSLNENGGGFNNHYKIVEDLNEFNENAYFVIDSVSEKFEENKVRLTREIKEKSLEMNVILSEIARVETKLKMAQL